MLLSSRVKRKRTETVPARSVVETDNTMSETVAASGTSLSLTSVNKSETALAQGMSEMEKFMNSSLSSSTVVEYKVNRIKLPLRKFNKFKLHFHC